LPGRNFYIAAREPRARKKNECAFTHLLGTQNLFFTSRFYDYCFQFPMWCVLDVFGMEISVKIRMVYCEHL